ncbi:MAG: archaellin/type IV pilin N-terminal domain-containing protein [Desulfurococcaceae archaeon]
MKAISPVVATLILIAIAVIAGVFVLRQFLFITGTTTAQQMIQIVDLALQLSRKYQPINETYTITWLSVTLTITVKNTGDRVVTLTDIKVDGKYGVTPFTRVNINPGQTYTGSYSVILDPETGETRTLFERVGTYWDTGSEHTVTVYYVVLGTVNVQSISQKTMVV